MSWWEEMAEADLATAATMQRERGIFAHYSLPSTVDGPFLSVWESCEPMSANELRAFIEGPARPAGSPDLLSSNVYAIDTALGGIASPSAWPHAPQPTATSTGSFFWCAHTFEFDAAADAFYALTRAHPVAALESPMPELIHHHCFLSTGSSAADRMFSVWETREPLDADEFHAFIDGPQSPLVGTTSVVYAVAAHGTPPAAAFPRQATFASAMMMPLMSDTMNVWDTMLPFKLTRGEEAEGEEAESKEEGDEAEGDEEETTRESRLASETRYEAREEEAAWEAALLEEIEAVTPLEVPRSIKEATAIIEGAAARAAGEEAKD